MSNKMSRTVYATEKLKKLLSNNTRNELLLGADKNGIIEKEMIFWGDDMKAIVVNNEEREKTGSTKKSSQFTRILMLAFVIIFSEVEK